MNAPASSTTLPPAWASLARAVWLLLVGATLVLYVIGQSHMLSLPPRLCSLAGANCPFYTVSQEDITLATQLGLPVPLLLRLPMAAEVVAKLSMVTVAVIIFWRRSADWLALLLSLSLALVLLEGNFPEMGVLQPLITSLYNLAILTFLPVPFLFPNGRFVPRWMAWVATPLAAALFALSIFVKPGTTVLDALWLPFMALAAYAAIYRFVRASSVQERQQIKWLAVGLTAPFVGIVPVVVFGAIYPAAQATPERLVALAISQPVYVLGYLALAVCLGFAILRYRLWDIDLIVRRTLIYGALTTLLVLVYWGAVVSLQVVFTVLTGQARSELVTVLSTLVIAALFVPLRRRLQTVIDRRFFRRKYDSARTLAAFGADLRDEVQLDELSERLVAVVEDTMQPKGVSVWLR